MNDPHGRGGAEHFDPARTIRLRIEMRRLWSRTGTKLLLAAVVLLPLALVGALLSGRETETLDARLLSDGASRSAANFTVFALYVGSQALMVMIVAYVFGESISRESSWSYLRVLLTVPITRGRLIGAKALTGAFMSLAALSVYTVVSYVVGYLVFGGGDLVPVSGPVVDADETPLRIVLMVAYIAASLIWIGALALFFSTVATDNPTVAVGSTLALTAFSHLLGGLPTLGNIRGLLPTRNFDAWTTLTRADVDWTSMQWGLFLSLVYGSLFGFLAVARMHTVDIRR